MAQGRRSEQKTVINRECAASGSQIATCPAVAGPGSDGIIGARPENAVDTAMVIARTAQLALDRLAFIHMIGAKGLTRRGGEDRAVALRRRARPPA